MDGFLMQLAMTLSFQLPPLLATVAVFCMLMWWTRPAPGRKLALIGASLLLGSSVAHLILGAVQAWMLRTGSDYTSVQQVIQLVSLINLLFNLIGSAGLVVLGWGTCRAIQSAQRN